MNNRELKKLSRQDLLELLLEQEKEIAKLTEELDRVTKLLEIRTVQIQESGSIAEASLRVSGVFEAAQEAAELYLENIKQLHEKEKDLYEKKEAEYTEKMEKLLRETMEYCEERRNNVAKIYG